MADYEKMSCIIAEMADTCDPDRREILKEKYKKIKEWVHPRVDEKMRDLRSRGIIDADGNLNTVKSA